MRNLLLTKQKTKSITKNDATPLKNQKEKESEK